MPSQTDEQALEAAIEQELTGTSVEEVRAQDGSGSVAERAVPYRLENGYWLGDPDDYNAEFAIDERRFWHFLRATQPEELEKLQGRPQWKMQIMERLDRQIKQKGVLQVLRKGLKVDHAHFTMLYATPLASSPEEVKQRFRQNEFSVTRQVQYSNANPREEIDMVVFVNGLPVATMELKNVWTGQNARTHGLKQYKHDRDENQPLLQFGRCVVHFAVDPDEVFMTTKLEGDNTNFLPFNKGHNQGSGNPPNPFGHKTAYLWEEVLTKHSLANLLEHFVRFDGKPTTPLSKKTLFFPRYHQLDVVRKLLRDVRSKGVGQRYLIQHSAGSGKSHSITWSAFQLIEAYPESPGLPGSKGMEQPLFDSVIVVTDRRILDKQIREHITQFSQVKNIVAPAYSSEELRDSLEDGKKIIITTIQKFPFIVEGISDLSDNRFAVVIDEAHSSQSGSTHHKMNRAMGRQVDEEEDDERDAQDMIIETMKNRKM
ncbi:MAG TPA: type I restriction endonuclease, partial [Fodinibius sp.]|nr:type I restriction endonuclease [Fodinibius sp.]